MDNKEEPEKQKVISVMANKNDITKRLLSLEGEKVNTITPITTSIVNLLENTERENCMIINIETNTKITTVIDGQIYQIDLLDDGMGMVLDEINQIENSFSKSYEVCKNMTIYTQNTSELYAEQNEYMDIVTASLYNIVLEIKRIMSSLFSNIDKIYLTGLGTCINNIDLYFQDYLPGTKCEILRPYFIRSESMQVPMKDYIEVNSAISLALDGLGMLNKNLDFSKKSTGTKAGSILQKEITWQGIKEYFLGFGYHIKDDFSGSLESFEKLLTRAIMACLLLAILFAFFSKGIEIQLNKKLEETRLVSGNTMAQLEKLDSDRLTIFSRTTTYKQLVQELTNPARTEENGMSGGRVITKDAIPNMLNRIMVVIPKKVKLISIKNTTSTHIEIRAEAEKYEQLGYFKAVLSTNGILLNVKSTSGQKSGSVVGVVIEGDLP